MHRRRSRRDFAATGGHNGAHVGDQTEVAPWGKNLLDKRYFAGLNVVASTGFANGTVSDPRNFGMNVTQKF